MKTCQLKKIIQKRQQYYHVNYLFQLKLKQDVYEIKKNQNQIEPSKVLSSHVLCYLSHLKAWSKENKMWQKRTVLSSTWFWFHFSHQNIASWTKSRLKELKREKLNIRDSSLTEIHGINFSVGKGSFFSKRFMKIYTSLIFHQFFL